LEQNRARGVDEVSAPRLRTHHHRLQAVWDLSLAEHSTGDSQLQALLNDAATALQADYVELYAAADGAFSSAGSPEVVGVLDLANYAREYALGPMTAEIAEPMLVADTDHEPIWGAHPLVTAIPLRSVLAMPLERSGRRHILLLAWKKRREQELDEEENRYLRFFQRIVSRLLENVERERELTNRVSTDDLTGLYNRSAMIEQVSMAVSAAGRTGESLALLYIDLDGFKELNNNFGHALGDAALREAAARMRSVLRKHEAAGRVGGDEFALLVTSFADEEQLSQIARRVLETLRRPITFGNTKARLSASIGIALYPKHAKTPEDLIEYADRAMYQAKRRDGDGFVIFGSREEARPPVRHLFAAHLADAAIDREFLLCYQPIVHARTGKPIAAEALIRWMHPGMGMLAPQKFLDESRDNHVLQRIEHWVLQSALDKQMRLRESSRHLTVHVNVSEPSDAILDMAHGAMADLRLEISGNAIAADEKGFARFIAGASERGLRVGLSNFGASRVSLSVLANLPLEFVKVTPDVSSLVVDAAHRFGWNVIAENVETSREREALLSLGVDALQGYYVCSPLAESDFDSWLEYQRR
jgi:diguanylate cyclase (GGDEF)-like protein